ncbi:hypothetical protein EOL73_04260 [Candidatus Saccharibacteria bacterium]|nr:hypothetical protein [Candidatus Saccharibacteria bacterium]
MKSTHVKCARKWCTAILDVQAKISEMPKCTQSRKYFNNWLYCLDTFTGLNDEPGAEVYCETEFVWPTAAVVVKLMSIGDARMLLGWRWPQYASVFTPDIKSVDRMSDAQIYSALEDALYLSIMSVLIGYGKTVNNLISDEELNSYCDAKNS